MQPIYISSWFNYIYINELFPLKVKVHVASCDSCVRNVREIDARILRKMLPSSKQPSGINSRVENS